MAAAPPAQAAWAACIKIPCRGGACPALASEILVTRKLFQHVHYLNPKGVLGANQDALFVSELCRPQPSLTERHIRFQNQNNLGSSRKDRKPRMKSLILDLDCHGA